MINVNSGLLFAESLLQLKRYKQSVGGAHKGRFIQMFLGLKYFQNVIPSMFSGLFATTEVVQTLLDDLYSKASRPANESVLMMFEGTFLARTGLIAPGNKTPQNTWRNNLNLQKGVGCYAPPADLASPTFLNHDRINCKYLSQTKPGQLAGSKCSLCPSAATYRNEDHRKWLRIDPGRNGYAVADLMNIGNFRPYVAPSSNRMPLIPVISALYHDANPGLSLAARNNVGALEFCTDFNFSAKELAAYFDSASSNPFNAALLSKFSSISLAAATPIASALSVTVKAAAAKAKKKAASISAPVLSGTPVIPPAINTGFEAERYAEKALRDNGWTVYDVSRQRLGYDLLAKKGTATRYVDVKSSLGMCAPTLTAREWQQSNAHGSNYVLAIIENFNPMGLNTVYWVPNPAACGALPSQTIQYAISRGSWRSASVVLASI
jgi:hypothetical protein